MNTEMPDNPNQNIDMILQAMQEWVQYERETYIETHTKEIERKAAELEITCDYYIAEFL